MLKEKRNLKEIEKVAKDYENVEEVQKALKSVQSIKSRLKKQKARKDYELKMTEVLQKEQLLKEVRSYLVPKKKTVTSFTKSDVENLDFDETMKALRSIQSKKSNTRYLADSTEFDEACKIEAMLLEHKENVKPIEDTTVRKTEIETLINQVETLDEKISKEYVLELLNSLL